MRAQGSYTIEAAIIVPIVLFCILFFMNQAIEMYMEVTEDTVYGSWWQEFEPADTFRRIEWFKNVTGEDGGEEEWK